MKGACRSKPPYFGLVKRSMNRSPGPTDRWWADHERSCGGSYTKIKEPAEFTAKQAKKKERSWHESRSRKRKTRRRRQRPASNSSSQRSKMMLRLINRKSQPANRSHRVQGKRCHSEMRLATAVTKSGRSRREAIAAQNQHGRCLVFQHQLQ